MTEIIVGTDGSEGAERALRWAVGEARRRHTSVRALMAWGYLDQHHADGTTEFDPRYSDEDASKAADAALAAGSIDAEDVPVNAEAVCALPSAALAAASQEAELLVVGSRGLGGFKGLLLGSVSDGCLSRSACPVVVVPPAREGERADEVGRIVVGVDGSARSLGALRWAIDEGHTRGAAVTVVHGWTMPLLGAEPMTTSTLHPEVFEQSAQRVLDEALEAVPHGPEQIVEQSLVRHGPAEALLIAGRDADLVVVGGPPPTGLNRLVGSTARQVIHHAPCPVVMVPDAGGSTV